MELIDAINQRHSVRSYTDQKIEGSVLEELQSEINACNQESGLSIQLCLNEPEAFSSRMARYGKFENVRNYIALVGKKDADLDEKCGYYGQRIAIKAQQLGLNTCWVAMTFSKKKSTAIVKPGEKLLMVIATGYGTTQGRVRKTKPIEDLCHVESELPDWFFKGMEAAQLAPTATNQQKFKFELSGDTVKASINGTGFYTKVDLGIVKYNFEVGAGLLGKLT